MSLARDDMNPISALDALEASFLQKTERIEEKKEISGDKYKEPEIDDVFENTSGNKYSDVEKLQEEHTALEMKNEELQKMEKDLESIDKTTSNREKEEALNRIQELRVKINEEQKNIAAMQKEIQQQVSSVIELQVGENADALETEHSAPSESTDQLKKSVVQEIDENPQKMVKIQLKSIDKNLLLAMLSLRE